MCCCCACCLRVAVDGEAGGVKRRLRLRWVTGPGTRAPLTLALLQESSVTCTAEWENKGGLALYIFGVLAIVIGLGVICEADYKHALMTITARLKLSDDVAGATFMVCYCGGLRRMPR